MADYVSLVPVQLTASADTTGKNSGNWTNAFTSDKMPTINPQYEIHHMTVISGPVLGAATIYTPGLTFPYSTVQLDLNGSNEWDPEQPLVVKSGGEIYFLWSSPVLGGSPPVVTLWPRYDVLIAREA